LVASAAGLVVLAGTGGAYAANQASTTATPPKPADRAAEQKAFLDDVATRLNVTRDQLEAALKGAASARLDAGAAPAARTGAAAARIDAAVDSGKLTKEQGEEAKKRIEANGVIGPGPLLLPGPG